MIVEIPLLYIHQYRICNHDCIYNELALHSHMHNLGRLNLLHSHMLDLPWRVDHKTILKTLLKITPLYQLFVNAEMKEENLQHYVIYWPAIQS